MDDSRKAGDGGRPEDENASAGSATGVFGVVAAPGVGSGVPGAQDSPVIVPPPWTPVAPPVIAQQNPVPVEPQTPVLQTPLPQTPPQRPPVQLTPVPIPRPTPATGEMKQPVVHRVVVGGDASGKASDYDELLNRLRAGGAAAAIATPVPASRKAPEADEVVPPRPTEAAPAPVAAEPSGGFTQLLRTMDADLVAPVVSAPVSEAAGQTAAASRSEAGATPPPAEPLPVEMRPIAAQVIDLRSPAQGAGFTALLRTLSPEKTVQNAPEIAPEIKLPQAADTPPAAVLPDPAEAQGAGGFTALLRAGSGEPLELGQGSQPPRVSDMPLPEAATQPQSQPAPPSFTEMFRALDGKGSNAGGGVGSVSLSSAPPTASPSTPSAGSPGTFTQMFRALDAKAENPPPGSSAFTPPAAVPPPAAQNEPGTFTQLFRALDQGAGHAATPVLPPAQIARAEPMPPQRGSEGSFTQMLSAQKPSDAPAYSVRPEPPRSAPAQWDSAPGQSSGQSWAAGGSSDFGSAPPREPERTPEPVSGGLTQLLRTLDGPGSTLPPRRDDPPPMPPSAAGPGMFTQTYQRLDGRDAPAQGFPPPPTTMPSAMQPPAGASGMSGAPGSVGFAASSGGATGFNQQVQPMAPPPAASGGPSEFTRILDASRMREMGLRGGGGAQPLPTGPGAPQAAPVAPPMMMPQPPMPQMPQAQMPAMPQPGMPQAPGGLPAYAMQPPAYAAGMPSYAPPQMAPPQMHAPQMAPHAMPAAPAPQPSAPAGGKTPKYLMPILIVAVFLLLVVVIALLFLMKH